MPRTAVAIGAGVIGAAAAVVLWRRYTLSNRTGVFVKEQSERESRPEPTPGSELNSVLDAFEETDNEARQITFEAAAEAMSRWGGKLGNDAKLQLYGLFKQATVGPCTAPRPSLIDMTGRAKWEAWAQLGDMSKEEAQVYYVEKVDEFMPRWYSQMSEEVNGVDEASGSGQKTGMGPVFSSLINDQGDASDLPADGLHNLAKEGNMPQLQAALRAGTCVNDIDEEGRTPLHWAADMGQLEAVELLLTSGASVNARDVDGMTPLHCAALCEHKDIYFKLVSAGGDPTIQDAEGETAADAVPSSWS